MKLGIIGVGQVGGALAQAAVRAGHEVTVYADEPSTVAQVAERTGARIARSAQDLARGAELLVLAVPYGALGSLLAELGPSLEGKVVVDVTNPLNATFSGLATQSSAAEEIQAAAPTARVVKAFNTIFAGRHGRPTEGDAPLDAFFAGDDQAAKAQVARLVASLGYRPIDVGGLDMARHLESVAFINIRLNVVHGWSWQSAWKLVGPLA